MEISELTLKLIILLIPGAIASKILEYLTVHKPWSSFKFVLYSILLGALSYFILQLLIDVPVLFHWILCRKTAEYQQLEVWSNLKDSSVPYREVFYSTLIGACLGIVVTWIDNYKVMIRLARWIGFSTKYGDENLFSYYLNSKETRYVYIRDIKNNLTYLGYVRAFSEIEEFKEITMSNVSVYRYSDSEPLYEIDTIYLCLPKDNVIIEQAKINEDA